MPLKLKKSDFIDYWKALNSALSAKGGPVDPGTLKPKAKEYMTYRVDGHNGFSVDPKVWQNQKRLSVWLYINDEDPKASFDRLKLVKNRIEEKFGYPLEWEENPKFKHRRIAYYKEGVNPEDRADWKKQHDWFVAHLNKLHRAIIGEL